MNESQLPYSQFIHGLSTQNIQLNRKVLSELAMTEPFSFKALADLVGGLIMLPAVRSPMPPNPLWAKVMALRVLVCCVCFNEV